VEGFSDSLRVEVAQFGIDVVIIRPAGVVTEWNQISRDSLVEASVGGAYEAQSVTAARTMGRVDNRTFSSGPRTIARTIARAATAGRPKLRYPTGRGARLVMGTRRVLPDRAFDAIMARAYLR
jgi:NAD(P)-dependent dehydrogenase (short-subunit alcohol dehydrogenase family)